MDVGVKRGAPRRVHCRLLLLVHLALFFEHNLRHLVIASFFESWNFSLYKTGNKMKIEQRRRFALSPQYLNRVIITGRVEAVMRSTCSTFPSSWMTDQTNDDLMPVSGFIWILLMMAGYGSQTWKEVCLWSQSLFYIVSIRHYYSTLHDGTGLIGVLWRVHHCDHLLPSDSQMGCRPGFSLFMGSKNRKYLCSLLGGFNSPVSRRREHLLTKTNTRN